MFTDLTTVGVYKTDVNDKPKADKILEDIQNNFPGSNSSFDLQDCDKVLRIESLTDEADERKIRSILRKYGYKMEKLL